jgi:hypothetical protein
MAAARASASTRLMGSAASLLAARVGQGGRPPRVRNCGFRSRVPFAARSQVGVRRAPGRSRSRSRRSAACDVMTSGFSAGAHRSAPTGRDRLQAARTGCAETGNKQHRFAGTFRNGSDGTRTRDLRRERPHRRKRRLTTEDAPSRFPPRVCGTSGERTSARCRGRVPDVWGMNGARALCQSSRRRQGVLG